MILCFNCVDHVKNVTGFLCIVDLDRHAIIAYHLLRFFFWVELLIAVYPSEHMCFSSPSVCA